MLLVIPIFFIALVTALFWVAASPLRLIYVLPLLLSFEYRLRLSSFSFDLSELSFFVLVLVCLSRAWEGKRLGPVENVRPERLLILLLAVFAFPAIFFETNTAHAASVYRDLMVPFLFLFVFLKAGLEKEEIHTLIKLACVFALANAVLGIVQYITGDYLWFTGPDEA